MKITQQLDTPSSSNITSTTTLFKQFLEQVKVIINYQAEQSSRKPVSLILLSGGGGNVKDLDVYLQQQLNIPTNKHQSWETLKQLNPKIKIPSELIDSTSYATALGLALEGLDFKI